MKKIAAIQSNYIPWKGYFDVIRQVDEFYLFDHVQYTSRNWRNRNCIKTREGLKWLTIPLVHKARSERICDKVIADSDWNKRHWTTLKHAYARAPHFREYKERIEALYLECRESHLSRINFLFLRAFGDMLGISTPLILLDGPTPTADKNEALIQLCLKAKADVYLTGPTTQVYFDEPRFNAAGIAVEWMRYEYPEYNQLYPPFEHKVSVLDLLFNEGADAMRYIIPSR